ncbi:MAG: hypothetical protein LUH19_01810 [Lachnospiraceae bacterium]|nr:hypothetical protein [Lachnospiraceae bacterium]
MDKKDKSEQDFHFYEKERYSTAGTVALVILLVLLLIGLGVLVWQLGSGIFQKGETETLEVTEVSKESEEAESVNETEDLSEDDAVKEAESSTEDDAAESAESSAEENAAESAESSAEDETAERAESSVEEETTESTESSSAEEAMETGSGDADSEPVADGSLDSSMTFTAVDETVTAKSATNLRSEPSTSDTDTVVLVLESGMQAQRTGINEDTGWSRLTYEGQTLYAVSSLLTTDLSGQTTGEVAADPDRVTTLDGRVIIFTACDDTVSPKMSTNLRTEPSTSQGSATVYYELQYGESVHRTGYDADAGWSRVEYDGQVLYAVTSYLYVVE